MWGTKGRGLRTSARAGLALLAAAVAHLGFRDECEAVRLSLLRPAVSPISILKASPALSAEPLGPDVIARLGWWRARRRGGLKDTALVPVMEYRADKQLLVVGAGLEQGVAVGDPVLAPSGLIGFVDRVEAHLARVALLAAPGTRVAVTLAESRPGLPGGMSRLNAVLEGDGHNAHLVQGSLLEAFRVGDPVVTWGSTAEHGAPAQVPVAKVSVAGPKPRVDLVVRPEDVGFVALGRAKDLVPPRLFENDPAELVTAPLAEGAGALVSGPAIPDVLPGSAVHVRDRYLGRVIRTSGSLAACSRLFDPEHEVSVRWIGADDTDGRSTLRSIGRERFRFSGGTPPPSSAAPILLLTAGGQSLVPADLVVGIAAPLPMGEGAWKLSGAIADWPAAITIPVFAFSAELDRLFGGGRR